MFYNGLHDGLYLAKQKVSPKGIDHYAIIDVGNRLGLHGANRFDPTVVHQRPPSITTSRLSQTGRWQVLARIPDEATARRRISVAARTPRYRLLDNNCEHVARYVATGVKRSTQVELAIIVAVLAGLAIAGS